MPRKRNLGPNASEKVGKKGKDAVNQRDVDRLQKKGLTLEKSADELGVAASSIATAYYQAEINNDPDLEIDGTERQVAKGIVSQRKQGVRWVRLAVRPGMSQARVKATWEEETGIPASETWVGKGAPPPGMTVEDAREIAEVTPKTALNGDEPAPKKRASAKRSPAKRSTVKRGAAKRSTAKARTRAERLAKSGKDNPS